MVDALDQYRDDGKFWVKTDHVVGSNPTFSTTRKIIMKHLLSFIDDSYTFISPKGIKEHLSFIWNLSGAYRKYLQLEQSNG